MLAAANLTLTVHVIHEDAATWRAGRFEMTKSEDFRRIVDRAVEVARHVNRAFGPAPPGSHS